MNWSLSYEDFNPEQESLREALCTLGNGYFATRGAAPDSEADEIHYPGTYLAGGYNRLRTEIRGHIVENEDLVNLPNWLCLSFRIGNSDWLDLQKVEILGYRQELDVRRGVLTRSVRLRDEEGRRTHLAERRLVHLRDYHLAVLEARIEAENWSGTLEIRSALDGRVVNGGVARYRGLNNRHLDPLEVYGEEPDTMFLRVRTHQSRLEIAEAARTRLYQDGEPLSPKPRVFTEPEGYIAQYFSIDMAEGAALTVEKAVALFTSRDEAISECAYEARKAVARAGRFDELLDSHVLAWEQLWRHFDMEVGIAEEDRKKTLNGDWHPTLILHIHIFHLLQTVSPVIMDLDVGVPARGLHGEAYRGHIFWDELFIFPLLNLRLPEITRALLKYRYRRLGEARANAQTAGYRGAMYPWQSGSDGQEESQQLHLNPKSGRWIPDRSRLQRHVNIAVAYNIWQYYQVTGDLEFMSFYGAEIILEIARFWASIASYDEDSDRYEILGVMGPDEYHDAYPDRAEPGLDNNAYTNVMAVWVLWRALEVLELLPDDRSRELREMLDLEQKELDRWQAVSRKMRVVFHGDGIISQFEGYERLEEFDWQAYRNKYGDIQRLDRILEAENDTPNRYQVSKQADVLMLFYLLSAEELEELFERLGYPFGHETIPKNIDYYMQRTSHGSTLSRVVHSWVTARSDRSGSWRLFIEALQSDVADIQGGTTPEGIHLGAMAGTVDLMQRCYTGIVTRGDVLWLNPSLPREITCLTLHIHYRGHSLDLDISDERVLVKAVQVSARPIKIGFKDAVQKLNRHETYEFRL